jgi:hypothetical protein
MTGPVQLALMVTPLATYLYLMAVWQAGRYPRVLSGSVDVWLLALGLGGLVLFGPVGDWLTGLISSRPRVLHHVLVDLLATLLVARAARWSRRRLVIYHVDASALDAALLGALGASRYSKMLDGFEDRERACGIRVEHSARWRWAVVEVHGDGAAALAAELNPRITEQLRQAPAAPSEVALAFFALSALTMLVPLAGHLLAQPRARAALRVLLERLHGG